jgi:tetratricopeptide (TPR) repeat protein
MPQENSNKPAGPELFTEENDDAEALVRLGNLPEAAKMLVEIIELDPDNYRAYNTIGIVAWMRKGWKDSLGMFIKAAALRPDFTDALINAFDAALKLHRIGDVEPLFEKAKSLRPDNEEIAVIYESILREGEGIYLSQRALRIGAYNPRIDEAQALLDEGKLHEAMICYLKINDAEGPSARVFSGLGVISYYQHRYGDAFSLFLESIKLDPTSIENFFNFLDAAKACGKTNEAKKIFSLYLKQFPFLREIAVEFSA